MSLTLKKLSALLLVFAMVFSFAACGDKPVDTDPSDETTLADEVTTADETTLADESTTAEGTTVEGTTVEGTTVEGETTAADGTTAEGTTVEGETTTQAEAKVPSTPAEILEAYTLVMNKAKADKPAYNKYEYQELPDDKRKIDGAFVSTLLNLAGLFMTSKEKAMKEPENHAKGDDTRWFPVYKADKGCLLTDTSAIKKATCVEQKDGTYKLTIALKEEIDPEPYDEATKKSPSNTGSMFSPLSRTKDIDPTLVNDNRVNKIIKDPDYTLKYYDCSATLVYNPKTNQIVTLEQHMSVLITCSGRIVLLGDFSGSAVLNNTMKIYNFKY